MDATKDFIDAASQLEEATNIISAALSELSVGALAADNADSPADSPANDLADGPDNAAAVIAAIAATPHNEQKRVVNIHVDVDYIMQAQIDLKAAYSQLRRKHSKMINEYVGKYAKGVLQRTKEWFECKRTTIGGSSIASIMGTNIYETHANFIMNKVGIGEDFKSNTAIAWGNMFENVIQKIAESHYDTKIVGTEIYIEHGNIGLSPDGIGSVTSFTANTISDGGEIQTWLQAKTSRVLFEFKCPFRRLPGNSPPKNYVPQVQLGLEHIVVGDAPMLDYGILVEGVFRLCTLDQLADGVACNDMGLKLPTRPKLYAMGILGLTSKPGANSPELDIVDELYSYSPDQQWIAGEHNDYLPCDLGNVTADIFDALAAAANEKHIDAKPWCSRISVRKDWSEEGAAERQAAGAKSIKAEIERFRQYCKKRGLQSYGILPWKLLDIRYHEIERRDPPILKEFGAIINETIEFIKMCQAQPMECRRGLVDNFMAQYGEGFD